MVVKLHREVMKNSNGFTLIEMLLVLSIVLLISSIVFQITLSLSERRVVDQFFEQVMLDIQEIQALAIAKNEPFNIQLYNNHYKGYGIFSGEIIFERDFPQNIKLDVTSNLKYFMVYPNGDVSNFGTIRFHTPFGDANLIIYIKEGRMRLVEL